MGDEPKKKTRRGIGSISQFATLGNAKTTENLDAQESKSDNPQTPDSQSGQESKQLDVLDPSLQNALATKQHDTKATEDQVTLGSKHLDAKEPSNLDTQDSSNQEAKTLQLQDSQESKRFIQMSEEELKRLMVEALQSQNVKAPKEEKPKRVRQTVYLEPDLRKKIRLRIAETGEDISDVVNLALKQLLEG
jgi:hypothetical protein